MPQLSHYPPRLSGIRNICELLGEKPPDDNPLLYHRGKMGIKMENTVVSGRLGDFYFLCLQHLLSFMKEEEEDTEQQCGAAGGQFVTTV